MKPALPKRILLVLLDPRPAWWARAWLWGAVGLVVWLAAPSPEGHAYSTCKVYSPYATILPDGSRLFQRDDGSAAETWEFTISVQHALGWGMESTQVDTHVTRSLAGNPAPAMTPSETQTALSWCAQQVRSQPKTCLDGEDMAQATLIADLIQSAQSGPRARVSKSIARRIAESTSTLAIALFFASLVIGALRGSQVTWYRIQLRRLRRGKCPSCGYSLDGTWTITDICPECGVNVTATERQVLNALDRHSLFYPEAKPSKKSS